VKLLKSYDKIQIKMTLKTKMFISGDTVLN